MIFFGDVVDPPEQIRIIGEVAELDRKVTEPGDYCGNLNGEPSDEPNGGLSDQRLPKRSQYRVSEFRPGPRSSTRKAIAWIDRQIRQM